MTRGIVEAMARWMRRIGLARPHGFQPRDELDALVIRYTRHFELLWLAVDMHGRLAVLISAGDGDLPEALLRLGSKGLKRYQGELIDALWELPVRGAHPASPLAMSDEAEVLCSRGLYIYDYDWRGARYELELAPEAPASVEEIEALMSPFRAAIPTVALRFAEATAINMRDLVPCRSPSDVPFGRG